MLHRLGVVFVLLLAGCSGATVPRTVEPTLAAMADLGLDCGDGTLDNVPGGLTQWRCAGPLEGADTSVFVDGSANGVAAITVDVRGSGGAMAALPVLERLARDVPSLSSAPGLATALASWTGEQVAVTVGQVFVSAACNATSCMVWVAPAAGPLQDVLPPP